MIESDRKRRFEAGNDIAQRVADENDVYVRRIDDARKQDIVCGNDDDPPRIALHLHDIANRHSLLSVGVSHS
jgi:hypothetical protein